MTSKTEDDSLKKLANDTAKEIDEFNQKVCRGNWDKQQLAYISCLIKIALVDAELIGWKERHNKVVSDQKSYF